VAVTALFDAVIRVSGDDAGAMSFRVDLVDRYHDGPDVPRLIGSSPTFTDLDDAVGWARGAIESFQRGT